MQIHSRLIVANWKMYLVKSLLQEILDDIIAHYSQMSGVIICPSSIHIEYVRNILLNYPNIILGAQNMSGKAPGAHTGSISAEMLKESGCKYVILGHSECRQEYREDDNDVAIKANKALEHGLIPIICVGSHSRNNHEIIEHISNQLSVFSLLQYHGTRPIIAYEPLWAIGSNILPTNEEIHAVLSYIKNIMPEALTLYGGSVNAKTSETLSKITSLNGVLVGGASIKISELVQIIANIDDNFL